VLWTGVSERAGLHAIAMGHPKKKNILGPPDWSLDFVLHQGFLVERPSAKSILENDPPKHISREIGKSSTNVICLMKLFPFVCFFWGVDPIKSMFHMKCAGKWCATCWALGSPNLLTGNCQIFMFHGFCHFLAGHFMTKYRKFGIRISLKARVSRSGGLRRKWILKKDPQHQNHPTISKIFISSHF